MKKDTTKKEVRRRRKKAAEQYEWQIVNKTIAPVYVFPTEVYNAKRTLLISPNNSILDIIAIQKTRNRK